MTDEIITREAQEAAERPTRIEAEKQRRASIAERNRDSTRNPNSWNEPEPEDVEAAAAADALIEDWGDAHRHEAPQLSQLSNIAEAAMRLGMSQEEMDGLRAPLGSEESQAAFDAAVDKIIAKAAEGRQNLQSLFDKKLNEIAGSGGVDPDDLAMAEEVPDAPEATLYDEAPDVADLMAQLDGVETNEEARALIQAAMTAAARGPQQSQTQDEGPSVEEMELELYRASDRYPSGAKLIRQLITLMNTEGATLDDQLAAAEAFATGREIPVPDVDRNNPPRPLTSGPQASGDAIRRGEMNDELADAFLSQWGKV